MLFDPDKCTAVVNGRHLSRWNRISADYDQDKFTGYNSGNGQSYHGKNPSKLGTFTFTLPSVNNDADYLDSLAEGDKPFPVSVQDTSDSKRRAVAGECRIKKASPMERAGADPTEQVWVASALDLDLGGQGDPDNDVEPIFE